MILDLELRENKAFYIYGAQVVAYGTFKAIEHLFGRRAEAYVVTCEEENPAEIDGVPVGTLSQLACLASFDSQPLFVVAVTERLHSEVVAQLQQAGFNNFLLLTEKIEHELMRRYYSSIGRFPLAEAQGTAEVDFCLYEVKHHKDRALGSIVEARPWERSLQAGAAGTDVRIAPCLDNEGENISELNCYYSEATAIYWAWKNTHHEWVGFEHYRRHLMVTPEMLSLGQYDAIMPQPYMVYPEVSSQVRRFISEELYAQMLDAILELYPEDYEGYLSVLEGQYQYTYNLGCYKREVLQDYCEWIFSITEHMRGAACGKEDEPALEFRALGYVVEALTNLYFMYNKRGWRIAHVAKEIYS